MSSSTHTDPPGLEVCHAVAALVAVLAGLLIGGLTYLATGSWPSGVIAGLLSAGPTFVTLLRLLR